MIKNIHFSHSLAVAALAIFMLMPGKGWGQLYWGGTAAESWTTTTGTRWGTVEPTYNTTWTSGSAAVFNVVNSTITGATTAFSSITANENVTVTPFGTLGTGGTIAIITVASGKTFNFGSQDISTAIGTGFIKSGPGSLKFGSTGGGAYLGGFTMNAGNVILGGATNSLGAGTLSINGGTLSASGTQTFSNGKFTTINISGDFSFGDASNVSNISFGTTSATTTTMSLGTGTARVITLAGTGTYTLWPAISGTSSSLTIAATAAGTLALGGANTYDGGTTITGGTLLLGAAGVLADLGAVTLNGGTLKTGATTGNSEAAGTLALTNNSTIALGTGDHTLTFAASNGITWSGTTLTITGWIGAAGTTGTAGKIFIGSNATGLTAAQLAKISFTGFTAGTQILSTGEVVPALSSPTLTAAAGATVDAPFDVTFTDNAASQAWVSAGGTAVTIDGTALTAGYSLTNGKITFTPSASVPAGLLQAAGAGKALIISKSGYSNATVTQTILAGAATKLAIKTQPTAPATNGAALATQPAVYIQDQYGNTTTSTASVVAAVGAGTWTLGGTTSVAAVAGTTTYSGLTATSAAAVTGATIGFTSIGLTPVTSGTFDIPAPAALPTISSFTPGSVCTGFTTSVTITGTNFTGATVVSFNGTSATFIVDSDTQITATSPISFTPGTISVTTPGGTATSSGSFTISTGLTLVTLTPSTTQTFCATATGTQLTATENGGGAITRQWGKRSATLGAITPITGATSQSYTPSGVDLGVGIWYIVCTSTPSCGSATISNEVTITVNAIPSIPDITPATTTTFCTGSSVVLASSAGTNYLWSTGATTETITVTTSGSYTVQVTTSGCQSVPSLPTVVTVNPFPSAAGTIVGTPAVTQGDAGVGYTVPAIADAATYIWSYSGGSGATITGTTNSVTIAFSLSATNGNLTVQGSNGCGTGAVSAVYPITVNILSTPFAYTVTGGGTYCSTGSSTFAVGLSGSQATVNYQLYQDGTAIGGLVTGTGNALDFSVQPAGTYTVKGSNGYTADMSGSAVIIAVNPPTAYAGAPNLAIQNAPYLLSGATATNYSTVTWSIVSGTGSFSSTSIVQPTFTGTAFPQTVQLMLTASNGLCTNATSTVDLIIIQAGDSKIWTGTTSTAWNDATNWNPNDGFIPFQTTNVSIPDVARDPIISSTAVCKNLTIASGAVLTINTGFSLTVAGTLTNSSSTTGLVIKSGGSLIETTGGVAATMERSITPAKYHLISVPNSTTTAGVFTGDYLQSWDETQAKWSDIYSTGTVLNPVQGYGLYTASGSDKNYSFSGTLLTGNQSTSISFTNIPATANDGANLLGNPYPSYLDWAGLQGTYGAVYYYNGSGYVTYLGGNGGGSQYVPPMQGFFIVATGNTTFTLNNTNRVHSTASYYKSGPVINSNTLVLATLGESYSDKLYVNFNASAYEGFDLQNDAYKFMAYTAGVSELYSFTGDKKLSIDVRPETSVIQLGFTNTNSGEYQIGIDKINDIPIAVLEDTKTATFYDLLAGAYKFSYSTGESDKRFLLHFGTTAVNETKKVSATVYSYQKTVFITMKDQEIGDIFIYNIAGQQVAAKTSAQGVSEIKLRNVGNYIVKVITKDNTVVRKVFIQ